MAMKSQLIKGFSILLFSICSVSCVDLLNHSDSTCAKTNQHGLDLMHQQQYNAAIPYFNKAMEQDSKEAGPYINRAICYSALGQHQKAVDDYSKGIEINPKYAVAYGNRSDSYNKLGQYDKAIDDCTKLIEMNPLIEVTPESKIGAYCNRGEAYLGLGEYQKAINDFDKTIELDSTTNVTKGEPYYYRAQAYDKLEHHDLAAKDFKRATELGYKPD